MPCRHENNSITGKHYWRVLSLFWVWCLDALALYYFTYEFTLFEVSVVIQWKWKKRTFSILYPTWRCGLVNVFYNRLLSSWIDRVLKTTCIHAQEKYILHSNHSRPTGIPRIKMGLALLCMINLRLALWLPVTHADSGKTIGKWSVTGSSYWLVTWPAVIIRLVSFGTICVGWLRGATKPAGLTSGSLSP